MGEQLELEIESKCDKCNEFKPRPFSYFTERMWFCADCAPPKEFTAVVAVANVPDAYGKVYTLEALAEAVNKWNETHSPNRYEMRGKCVYATIVDDAAWAKANHPTTKTHSADGIPIQVTSMGVVRRDYEEDCEDISELLLHLEDKKDED
jgi:hypothetical protein